jgi:hypothetical protein
MSFPRNLNTIFIGALVLMTQTAEARTPNHISGTWRMISAQIEKPTGNIPAYGSKPSGLLVFTEDMHYVEVLTDGNVPQFASNVRGHGTPEENQAAMAGSIGMFGTYTVDDNGDFSGDRVEGSTFPNWVGDIRTRKDLQIVLQGDEMTENFQRPDGTKIVIVWHRVR